MTGNDVLLGLALTGLTVAVASYWLLKREYREPPQSPAAWRQARIERLVEERLKLIGEQGTPLPVRVPPAPKPMPEPAFDYFTPPRHPTDAEIRRVIATAEALTRNATTDL